MALRSSRAVRIKKQSRPGGAGAAKPDGGVSGAPPLERLWVQA